MAYINGKEILFSAIVDTVEQSQLRELQAENQELTTENQELTTENQELTTENQELTTENQELTSQVETLTSENIELQSKNDSLVESNNSWRIKNDALTAQNTELTAQNTELTSENQRLETENIEVKARVDELEVENDIISAENAELILDKNELLDNFTDVIQGDTSEIIIPDDVTAIREYALYRHRMTGVVLPESVASIDRMAFASCTKCLIYDFTKHKSVPTLVNQNAFDGISSSTQIKVPAMLYSQWIAATNWAAFVNNIVAVIDGIVAPSNDSEVESVAIHTAHTVHMGFYFSENLNLGTRYVEHTWIDYDEPQTDVYELSIAEEQSILTMNGNWTGDLYEHGGYTVRGEFYIGSITFKQSGTYRIYQTYYDATGNECESGAYVFEVT